MGPEENGEQGDQKQKEQEGSGLDSRAIDFINRARGSQETQGAKTGGRLAGKAGKKAAGKAGKRMAAQAGKQVGKMAVRAGAQAAVAAGETLVSTAPIWGIPALIISIVIVVIVIIFGGAQQQDIQTVVDNCGGNCQVTCNTSLGETQDASATCAANDAGQSQICCIPQAQANSNILYWTKVVNDAIVSALGCSSPRYNRQQQTITNASGYSAAIRSGTCSGLGSATYFCTSEVRDVYNLAGYRNSLSEYTPSMVAGWNNVSRLFLITTNNTRLLKPGDAIFWWSYDSNRYAHAAIIYAINVDSYGDGRVTTMDANVNQKIIQHSVRNWRISGSVWAGNREARAFGSSI